MQHVRAVSHPVAQPVSYSNQSGSLPAAAEPHLSESQPYYGFKDDSAYEEPQSNNSLMSLTEGQTAVDQILGEDGVMAQQYDWHTYRRTQLQMAQQIVRAIAQKAEFMAEEGTGTGKTFAYLIPSLLMSSRVIVSTQTNALQDQLLGDVKTVETVLGRQLKVAVLKGRDKYLCIRRVKEAVRHPDLYSKAQTIKIRQISTDIDSRHLQSG